MVVLKGVGVSCGRGTPVPLRETQQVTSPSTADSGSGLWGAAEEGVGPSEFQGWRFHRRDRVVARVVSIRGVIHVDNC